MHTSQSIGHTVRSRSCSHVIWMKGTSCTAAGCNGEILLALLDTFLLICTCNRMLETCGVGRVTSDRYVYALLVHDCNTFANVVGAIAVYLRAKSLRVRNSLHLLQFACVIIIICLNICKSVNSGNNLRCVLSKSVQDNAKRFLTNLVSLLCNTDGALCSSK